MTFRKVAFHILFLFLKPDEIRDLWFHFGIEGVSLTTTSSLDYKSLGFFKHYSITLYIISRTYHFQKNTTGKEAR